MTSTQRMTRRRTAVYAFDDENESAHPSAKKAKLESNKQVNGRVNAEATRRAKPSYDEDDNGFQFSRAKSKKSAAKAQSPPPQPAPTTTVIPSEASHSPAAKKRRKKYSFSDTKEVEAPRATRRSARLSGDKEELKTSSAQTQQAGAQHAQQHEPTTRAKDGVAKSSEWSTPQARQPKKIALPFADTPVIRRNKEMRNKTSESTHRRSSTGMRGRRASSLIDSGASNAVPHTDVEPSDFFKHIEQSLPEPRRMKQLLTWCATRALPEKQPGDAGDGGALLAARHIEEEILKDIVNRPEMSDWFSREDLAPVVLVKKQNPRNTQMASKLSELEQEIKRLQTERDQWEALLKESARPSTQPAPLAAAEEPPKDNERRPKLRPPPPEFPEPTNSIDIALLEPSQATIYSKLSQKAPKDSSAEATPLDAASVSQQVSRLATRLEPAVDIFVDGLHKVSQYRRAADRVADKILSSAAEGLEQRHRDIQAQAAAERGVQGDDVRDVKDVLHALAGVLNGE